MTNPERTVTAIDAIADEYLDTIARLDPVSATEMGVRGHDAELPDYSPDGHEERARAAREVLARLDAADPADETDRVTVAAMRSTLGVQLDLHDAGEDLSDLNCIASPVQTRDVFDLMDADTLDDWAVIRDRLAAFPAAFAGYRQSLATAARAGHVVATRQVAEGVRQARELADAQESFFTTFLATPEARRVLDGSTTLTAELDTAAAQARAAYADLADFLATELAPASSPVDAVGRERYQRFSRAFVGATVDLDETYAWGLDQLARISAEQEEVAGRIAGPGASVADAVAVLDTDPARTLTGTDALQRWMQETSDTAIAELDGVHFDIPDALKNLECRIAPTQSGGIYYTGPSDDLSRPGRMWWSVPPGVTSFATWREKTTVYHEGVPGHHLQVGLAVVNRAELNGWRRLASWTSGHGEGWALYAERLMSDLGFLTDDGDRLGMLDGQRLRAARVVFDIGVHLGKPAPAEYGGGTWDADKGWDLLVRNINMNEPFLRFEWLRYLGWPGQAPSYLIGQRLWTQIRDRARRSAGDAFSLRDFHTRALNLGSLPLEVLDAVLT